MSTITDRAGYGKGSDVGQLIMLGTLFGLIILIYGLVIYFDSESRGPANEEVDR